MSKIKFRVWDEFPRYEVGSDGSVWSKDYNHTGKRKQLKQHLDKDGYPILFLAIGGKRYKRVVHRMVAISFLGKPKRGQQVNHKNGVRNDNFVENLEWCTCKENVAHSYRVNGRKMSENGRQLARERFAGTANPTAKVNYEKAETIIEMRSKGIPLKEVAKLFGISVAQVSVIARKKYWNQHPNLLQP